MMSLKKPCLTSLTSWACHKLLKWRCTMVHQLIIPDHVCPLGWVHILLGHPGLLPCSLPRTPVLLPEFQMPSPFVGLPSMLTLWPCRLHLLCPCQLWETQ